MQNNFRGYLYRMYIINTPKSITIPWAICKSFIEPITVEKI